MIKIDNENNESPNQRRKLKKNTQLQITSWVIPTSEPSLNQESTNSVVRKIKTEKTEIKTALKKKIKLYIIRWELKLRIIRSLK